MKEDLQDTLFDMGDKIENEHFKGDTYLCMLTDGACPIGNVTFMPGSRNAWHMHEGGQILLVTCGEGYYQAWGEQARKIQKGDVVEIPAHVKHWHGARKNTSMSHLAIEVHPQLGPAIWLEPVTDEHYELLP